MMDWKTSWTRRKPPPPPPPPEAPKEEQPDPDPWPNNKGTYSCDTTTAVLMGIEALKCRYKMDMSQLGYYLNRGETYAVIMALQNLLEVKLPEKVVETRAPAPGAPLNLKESRKRYSSMGGY